MSDNKLKIGITQGDVNGIGWETILKALADLRILENFVPVVYGSRRAAEFWRNRVDDAEAVELTSVASAAEARRNKVNFVDTGDVVVAAGKASAEAGAAAVESLRCAVADLKAGELDAIVTAPFNKETTQSDNFRYAGHTDYLADELGGEPLMLMCSDRVRVGLVTTHVPVAEVARQLTTERIAECICRLNGSLVRDFGVVRPRIAVLALNPHAGDGGVIGDEEERIIKPAVAEACAKGVLAFGPLAADGLFGSGAYAKYDAVLAMYHDQGLAPFKTISPDGVNFTAGLDYVRTSPDHGVAYDIVGQGKADAQSMRNAIYAAIDIVERRRRYDEWSANPLQKYERERGDKVDKGDRNDKGERGERVERGDRNDRNDRPERGGRERERDVQPHEQESAVSED